MCKILCPEEGVKLLQICKHRECFIGPSLCEEIGFPAPFFHPGLQQREGKH